MKYTKVALEKMKILISDDSNWGKYGFLMYKELFRVMEKSFDSATIRDFFDIVSQGKEDAIGVINRAFEMIEDV